MSLCELNQNTYAENLQKLVTMFYGTLLNVSTTTEIVQRTFTEIGAWPSGWSEMVLSSFDGMRRDTRAALTVFDV